MYLEIPGYSDRKITYECTSVSPEKVDNSLHMVKVIRHEGNIHREQLQRMVAENSSLHVNQKNLFTGSKICSKFEFVRPFTGNPLKNFVSYI